MLPTIIAISVLLMLLIVFVSKYQTARPDEALIISGSYLGSKNIHIDEGGNKIEIIRDGDAFVLPVFQHSSRISLLLGKLDVSIPEVYTEQGVPVMCDGTSVIRIGPSVEEIAIAAGRFLGKTARELENETREVLEGYLCSILGSMTVEEIYQNRDRSSRSVQGVASADSTKMSLVIVSFTTKKVRDKNGYLDSLGKPRIAQVEHDADIAEAEALKETRIKKAEAEKESQQVGLQRQTGIAEASEEKELRLALYRQGQDITKVKADQAYNLESTRAQQHVVEQEMEVKVVEHQEQIKLEEKEIARREKQYGSEMKRKADIGHHTREQEVLAQKTRKVVETEVGRFKVGALAEVEADKARLTDQAQAEAILARGAAEAEAKQKIVDAFKEYGEAAVLSMMVGTLPQLMKEAAQPLGSIDEISVVDTGADGENSGANRITNYATDLLAGTQEILKEATGLDVKELIEDFPKEGTSNSMNYHATEGSEKE